MKLQLMRITQIITIRQFDKSVKTHPRIAKGIALIKRGQILILLAQQHRNIHLIQLQAFVIRNTKTVSLKMII